MDVKEECRKEALNGRGSGSSGEGARRREDPPTPNEADEESDMGCVVLEESDMRFVLAEHSDMRLLEVVVRLDGLPGRILMGALNSTLVCFASVWIRTMISCLIVMMLPSMVF